MPVVQWVVKVGYAVEARDGHLGTVREIFQGPPQSAQAIFVSSEPYMRVVEPGQPDLYIPFEEIVDVSDIKDTVYLKRMVSELNALGWTRDPRRPDMVAAGALVVRKALAHNDFKKLVAPFDGVTR